MCWWKVFSDFWYKIITNFTFDIYHCFIPTGFIFLVSHSWALNNWRNVLGRSIEEKYFFSWGINVVYLMEVALVEIIWNNKGNNMGKP